MLKTSPIKLQKLSPEAAAAKKKRDLAYANGPYKKKRAENQRKRRAALKKGVNLKGKDYDHRTSSFKSVAYNRGGGGNGTKNE